jgi:hypothetical protein
MVARAVEGTGVRGGVRVGVKTNRNVGDAVGVRLGVYVGRGVQVEVGEGVVNRAVLVWAAPAVAATMVSNMPGAVVGTPDEADRIGKSQPPSKMTSIPDTASTPRLDFATPTSHQMLSPLERESSTERES